MPSPEHIHTAARLFPCVSASARRGNRRTYKQFQDGIRRSVFMFFWNSLTPSIRPPPRHFSSSHMLVKTASRCTHTSLSHPLPPPPPLKGPWAASREFFGLSVQITQTIKTLQSAKPRLQPPGYALVNLSITLRASLPCCCPDTNTQPTQPKS